MSKKPDKKKNGAKPPKRGSTLNEPPVAEQLDKERVEKLDAEADEILANGKKLPDARHASDPTIEDEARKAVIKKRFDRMLPVKLTEIELRQRSRRLANTVVEIDGVNARKKIANDGFKAELERWTGVQAELSKQVDTGEELRQVQCREVHDYPHKLVLVYRNDTNVLVERREMSAYEMQPSLYDETDNSLVTAEVDEVDVDPETGEVIDADYGDDESSESKPQEAAAAEE